MAQYARVTFEVCRATQLLGINPDGKSNAFAKVEIGKTSFTTPVIDSTTEPNWKQRGLPCTFTFGAVHIPTVVTIFVYNKLPYGDSLNDLIGQASVTVLAAGQKEPQMLPLTHGGNLQLMHKAPTGCGSIEVCFNAESISEEAYFDALMGKVSAPAPAPAPAPAAQVPAPALPQQQTLQQLQQSFTPAAAATAVSASTTFLAAEPQPSAAMAAPASASSAPVDAAAAPATAPPVLAPTAATATPDVSVVGDIGVGALPSAASEQTQQPQQTSFPNSRRASENMMSLGLPPVAPTSSSNNNNNNQNHTMTMMMMQGPLPHAMASVFSVQQQHQSSGFGFGVQPPPGVIPPLGNLSFEPQAHVASIPSAAGYYPAPVSISSSNITPLGAGGSTSGRGGPSVAASAAAAAGKSNNASSRPTSARGARTSNVSSARSAAVDPNATDMSSAAGFGASLVVNRSSAASHFGSGGAKKSGGGGLNSSSSNNNLTSSGADRISLNQAAARWFDLIRSGNTNGSCNNNNNGPATALREIRSYSEREPAVVIECCDASGRSLLHEAAWSGSVELFQELLALAIRAGHTRPTATSMQLWASEHHNIAAWTQAPSKYVTANAGNTVLHTAACAGRADLCDWMLRQGAVFVAMAQSRNKRGMRPLECATERGHIEAAQVLARSTVA